MSKWYSILYKRIKQNNSMFIFIPVYYIKGDYEKETRSFYDEGGNLYFSNEEFEVIRTDEEYTHYYPIHVDDLKNRYQFRYEEDRMLADEDLDEDILLSEEECIGQFFEDIKDTILIGNILHKENQIDLISMSYEKWMELARRNSYSTEDGKGILTITKTNLEKLLLNKDLNEIKKELEMWLRHTGSIERMAVTKNVDKIVMSPDNKRMVAVEERKDGKSSNNGEKDEDYNKSNTHVKTSRNPKEILKYIQERMVVSKDSDIIKSILALILGNLEAKSPEEMSHIFSIGPTGTGKTYIYKLLSKILDVPIIIEDCNNITQEGYVGTSIEDLIGKIYVRCDSDVKKAERAIVYLDEIDKIAARGSNVSDIGAQSALLKFIEGSTYTITTEKGSGKKVTIDTSMMTICAGGAFSDLTLNKNTVGFNSNSKRNESIHPSLSDIINYGLYPELIGRFTNFVFYEDYSKEEYRKVLLESLDSPYLIKKSEFLRRFNVELVATDSFFDKLADVASKKRTGFRGIKLDINTTLLPAQIKLQFDSQKYKELVVSDITIDNPKEYILR